MNNHQLRILLARSCMSAFVRHTMPGYLMGWVHERICEELDAFLEDVVAGRSPRLMLTMPPRHGKLCADDTEVPTPGGWRRHGDLLPGDLVLGLNGQPVRVLAVGDRDMASHRVRFSNGASVAVHLAHEWTLYDCARRTWRTVETRELALSSPTLGGRKLRWSLPAAPGTGAPAHVLAVEPLREPVPGRCIQVASPDGLYLVTRQRVPTHNSELASRRFPAYVLGRYPDMSIISASYSADLSSRMNRDVQRIMDDPVYQEVFPDTKLSTKNIRTVASGSYLRNSDIFEIVNHNGVYRSAGVGGGLTGMGAEICILDDVIKDRASADSPTVLQNVWDWYTSTLYTRLAPGGGIILMNTRWCLRDLSGRLLEAEAQGDGDKWRVVNFSAIATEDEPPYRMAGEALHPARYPVDQLLKIKAAVGIRDWEALYQQRPIPDGGAVFRQEWLEHVWLPKDLPERFDELVQSWDLTFSGSDTSDFVCGQVWGRKGAAFYLLDEARGRWSFTETLHHVRELSRKWPLAVRKLVEDKANGPALLDTLKRELPGLVPVHPEGSKEQRAHAVTALWEAGNVLLPTRSVAPWIEDWKAEVLAFPHGAHDDRIDSMTYALRRLHGRGGLRISEGVHAQVAQMQRQMQARQQAYPWRMR